MIKCISSFKKGKSPDVSGVTIEHLKYGGNKVFSILVNIINFIFQNVLITDVCKTSIGCPIYKKGGKPQQDPGSYRRITVTSAIGKILEKLHLNRNKKNISEHQSCLQRGFTEGVSPTVAGLILTELHTEARETKSPLYIAFIDAKNAFDVVWHNGLLREMYKVNLIGDNWLLFKAWYENLRTRIKWQGQTSREFGEL